MSCVWSLRPSITPGRPGCFGRVLSVLGMHVCAWSVYPSILHGHRRVPPTIALRMCQQPAPRYSASERALPVRREGGVATSGSGPSLASVKLDFRDRGDATLVPHASSTMSSAMQSPVAFHPTVRRRYRWCSPCRRRVWGMSEQLLAGSQATCYCTHRRLVVSSICQHVLCLRLCCNSVCTCQVLEFDGEDKSGHRSRTAGSRRAPPTAVSTSTSTTLALTGGSSAGAGSASGPGTGAKGGRPEGKEADDVTQRFVWRACRGAPLPYAPAVQRTPSVLSSASCVVLAASAPMGYSK
jgi:hypothetical protein